MSLHPSHPRAVILSGKNVRADIKSARVGIYDEIREDVRQFATVQPVDEVVIERTKTGWQGLLYSGRDAFMFCFDSSGFAAKPVSAADSKVMRYAYRLIDEEAALTAKERERQAAKEQEALNEKHNSPSTPWIATLGEGEPALKKFKGPQKDHINRDILSHKVIVDTVAISPEENLAAGGVVTNDEGKLLIVKPTGGYGGYDWTFPKGGLETREYDKFGIDGLETAAKREILEETGCIVETERFVTKIKHQDGGTCYYFAMKLVGELPKNADATDGEIAERKWVTALEAMELLHENDDIKVLSLATQKVPKLVIKSEKLKGGLADGKTDKDFDEKQLDAGKKVEREHTKDKAVAAEIARDHLTEDKDYYKKLKTIEKSDLAKASHHTGVMVALFLPNKLASELAVSGGEPAENLHVTLAYLGKNLTNEQIAKTRRVVKAMSSAVPSLAATFTKYDRFEASIHSEGRDVQYLAVDSDDLRTFRAVMVNALAAVDVPVANDFEYTPHVTIKYVPPGESVGDDAFKPRHCVFPTLSLAAGPAQEHFAFRPKLIIKALPKQSKVTKDAKAKKKGATPIKAGEKKAGVGGKTRYNYPDEKGPKKPAAAAPAGPAPGGEEAPPPAEMNPITVPKDGEHAEPPAHTVDLSPLLQLTDMTKDKWVAVAKRFQKDGMGERHGFMRYMQTHLKEFASKYNLDGDYFGLVYDVLTGANPGVKPPTSQNK